MTGTTVRRGDIVVTDKGKSYCMFHHVEYVHGNGALDVISDIDGRRVGLSESCCEIASISELIDWKNKIGN